LFWEGLWGWGGNFNLGVHYVLILYQQGGPRGGPQKRFYKQPGTDLGAGFGGGGGAGGGETHLIGAWDLFFLTGGRPGGGGGGGGGGRLNKLLRVFFHFLAGGGGGGGAPQGRGGGGGVAPGPPFGGPGGWEQSWGPATGDHPNRPGQHFWPGLYLGGHVGPVQFAFYCFFQKPPKGSLCTTHVFVCGRFFFARGAATKRGDPVVFFGAALGGVPTGLFLLKISWGGGGREPPGLVRGGGGGT